MLRYSGDVECRHCRLGNEAADDSVRTPNSTDTLHSPVVLLLRCPTPDRLFVFSELEDVGETTHLKNHSKICLKSY